MMATGFLGFLTIAQNDLNTLTKQQQQQDIKTTKFYKSGYITGKRYFSTSSRVYTTTNSQILTDFIKEKNLKPVYVYENLQKESTRKNIVKETIGLSGIYLILNKVTKDYYIGSASTNRLHKRFSNHLINLTGSKVLKNAVRKYKLSEFAFLVLELFPEIVDKENNKKLLDLEDFYLKSLLPNYNILTEAGSSFGYKHTEITRINMKSNYSEERRMFIGNLNKGKVFTDDERKKYSLAALNRKKAIYSEQAILNMKKASKPDQ